MEKTKAHAIEIKNFTKKYNRSDAPAVDNVSFSVEEGNFHGFIGANGAGKTTTIKSLIGAYTNFQGEISFFGHKHLSVESKRVIGYVPESATFPSGVRTITYLKWFGFLSGMSFKKAKERALFLLKEQGLENLANKKPNKFSSGQKKSILLTQALLHDPKILIMDEPAANLDPTARIEFFDKLQKLQKQGKTIFISSHILLELEKYVSSLTILDGGKIVFNKKMEEINKEGFCTSQFITSNQKAELKALLVKFKMKPKNFKDGFNITINSQKEKDVLLKELLKNKISFNVFKDNKKSLEDIYKKYVKFGSNHTNSINKEEVKNA